MQLIARSCTPWQKMIACCHVSQNLYLHEMEDFLHIDRILLVDIDTLRLDDPQAWWSHFEVMRQTGTSVWNDY